MLDSKSKKDKAGVRAAEIKFTRRTAKCIWMKYKRKLSHIEIIKKTGTVLDSAS
jgi:hypothetical protein